MGILGAFFLLKDTKSLCSKASLLIFRLESVRKIEIYLTCEHIENEMSDLFGLLQTRSGECGLVPVRYPGRVATMNLLFAVVV